MRVSASHRLRRCAIHPLLVHQILARKTKQKKRLSRGSYLKISCDKSLVCQGTTVLWSWLLFQNIQLTSLPFHEFITCKH